MDGGHAAPHDEDAPWSLPEDFLPVPAAFNSGQQVVAPINLREYTHTSLVQLATDFNHEVHDDPFEAVLKGIPERARLLPNRKEPQSIYMGLEGLPPHGRYAKAWRKIMRTTTKLDLDGGPPAKRVKSAAAAAAEPKGANKSDKAADRAIQPTQWTWAQLQPVLVPEQQRWRKNLAAFLARPVDVPLLAPGAPVLDLQKLFLDVMEKGGYDRVSAANGWATMAQHMQRDAAFGPLVAAVYACYLHPLEQGLPYGFRAAKAQDHMASRVQSRNLLGAKLATHDGVVFAADRAEGLLRQLQLQQPPPQPPSQQPPQPSQPPPAQTGKQAGRSKAAAAAAAGLVHKQQQKSHSLQQQQQKPASQQQQQQPRVDIARCSLQLLSAAAQDPGQAVDLLKQHGLHTGLHAPSRAACLQEYRKKYLVTFKRARGPDPGGFTYEERQGMADDIMFGGDSSSSDSESSGDEGDTSDGEAGEGEGKEKEKRRSSAAAAAARGPPDTTAAAAAAAAAAGHEGEGDALLTSPELAGNGASSQPRQRGRPPGSSRGRRPSSAAGRGRGRRRGRGRGGGNAEDPDSGGEEGGAKGKPAAAAAASAGPEQAKQQQQLWRTDRVTHDAARWLLLSRRAVLSGPPGSKTPLLHLPGMQKQQQDKRGASNSGAAQRSRRGNAARGGGRGGKGRKRTFYGHTPRCGNCHTCLNPALHKPCKVNREKLKIGLKPVLPGRKGRPSSRSRPAGNTKAAARGGRRGARGRGRARK